MTIYIDGLEYKIGFRGIVFYWNNEEWIKSSKPASEIQKAIDKATMGTVKTDPLANLEFGGRHV